MALKLYIGTRHIQVVVAVAPPLEFIAEVMADCIAFIDANEYASVRHLCGRLPSVGWCLRRLSLSGPRTLDSRLLWVHAYFFTSPFETCSAPLKHS